LSTAGKQQRLIRDGNRSIADLHALTIFRIGLLAEHRANNQREAPHRPPSRRSVPGPF